MSNQEKNHCLTTVPSWLFLSTVACSATSEMEEIGNKCGQLKSAGSSQHRQWSNGRQAILMLRFFLLLLTAAG